MSSPSERRRSLPLFRRPSFRSLRLVYFFRRHSFSEASCARAVVSLFRWRFATVSLILACFPFPERGGLGDLDLPFSGGRFAGLGLGLSTQTRIPFPSFVFAPALCVFPTGPRGPRTRLIARVPRLSGTFEQRRSARLGNSRMSARLACLPPLSGHQPSRPTVRRSIHAIAFTDQTRTSRYNGL